jgi:hypothetical protein
LRQAWGARWGPFRTVPPAVNASVAPGPKAPPFFIQFAALGWCPLALPHAIRAGPEASGLCGSLTESAADRDHLGSPTVSC